jgi:hypothetical protein
MSLIVYWVIGFRAGFDLFLLFTLFMILISMCGTALGLAIGAMFQSTAAVSVLVWV